MRKVKLNIPMTAALVLLLLTMVSTHFTAGLYARYTSTFYSHDSARVAKFDVDSTMTENADGTYTLTVDNKSEVAIKYSIIVEMDAHLQVTVDGVKKTLPEGASSVTLQKDDWKLAPGGDAQSTVEFEIVSWDGLTDSGSQSGESEQVELGFTVKVAAEQID